MQVTPDHVRTHWAQPTGQEANIQLWTVVRIGGNPRSERQVRGQGSPSHVPTLVPLDFLCLPLLVGPAGLNGSGAGR